MVIGLATLELQMFHAPSLKEKRRVVRSLRDRIRARFNVAVAEVDSLEARDRITLGIACVSNSRSHAQSVLQNVIDAVEQERMDATLVHFETELI